MAPTRDYYADLELPATADIADIKKQFRKLALKYHPDRNPGREQEVNSKFQIIQTAHETLSDPQQKARYDATLGRSSRAGASGVRGNPWANVGQQFPTPPKRSTAARGATSGAQRWQTRFSNGVPPTAKQGAAADPEAKKNAARAFESMRKTQTPHAAASAAAQPPRPSQPPPPPPRTESARQRAEASFGARRPGYQPRSAVPGDEPPVSAASYYSRANAGQRQPPPPPPRQQPQAAPMPDPLSQFRDREAFGEPRHSAPYCSHGGEKTNLFDGVPLGRAKSSRETYRRDDQATSDDGASTPRKSRSSSLPRSGGGAQGAPPPPHDDGGRGDAPFGARPSSQNDEAEAGADPGASSSQDRTQGQGGNGPSMYGTPLGRRPRSHSSPPASAPSLPPRPAFADHGPHHFWLPSAVEYGQAGYGIADIYGTSQAPYAAGPAPSGGQGPACPLASFDQQQHLLLDQLIRNHGAARSRAEEGEPLGPNFTFPVGNDAFEQTSPSPDGSRFGRSSVDDIDTHFVDGQGAGPWHFSAGSGERQQGSPTGRPRSGGRSAQGSPPKRPTMRQPEAAQPPSQADALPTGFNPDGWSDKFGPQNFVPQPTPGPSVSPTRRANSKKVKTRPTAGNAAVVIDGDSSGEETYEWRGRNAGTRPAAADSPQAMDIDPPQPPPPPPSLTPPAAGEPNGVRNIPVEPTRPEWRPGHVDGVAGDIRPPRPAKLPVNANTFGSEDSEDICAGLADLRNVAPFAQTKSGLRSLDDLRDNLPFESRASDELPIKMPKAAPLAFPAAPEAPRLPPTVAIEGMRPNTASWAKYLDEFEAYLRNWDDFNGQVVDHFATRKTHIAQTRGAKGYAFLGAHGGGDVQSYYHWVQQDNDVRRRWSAACEEHELRLRQFMTFRDRMKLTAEP